MGVGDSLARWVFNNQPTKFAAIELVAKTGSDVPETLLRPPQLRRQRHRRHPDPRSGVEAVGPGDGKNTVIEGLDPCPP